MVKEDREYVLTLIQDLKVKLRDITDYKEHTRLKRIIKKFEQGFKEEFGQN
ncbi:MAG: hypothetical protein ACTSU2_10740 [Promethearchaeota archaeon]